MPEFTDFDRWVGISQGRLDRSYAEAGEYLYAITDENQHPVDVTVPGAFTEIIQNVDVTAISGILFRLRYVASPDSDWRVECNIAGFGAFTLDVPQGDPDQDWRPVVIPCGKLVGVVAVAVTVQALP